MFRIYPAVLILLCSSAAFGQITTAQYDNARTGANTREMVLTPANVNSQTFGKVGTLRVDGDVYAQPLYLPNVGKADAKRNLLFVATEHDSVYAFDADLKSETPIWHRQLIDEARGITTVRDRDVECPFIRPEIGITGTPVIDAKTGTLYVLARSKEHDQFVQKLHALDVATGNEKFGGPIKIETSVIGATRLGQGNVIFDALRENQRAALLLSDGKVYIAWASSCDVGPYYGWVMAYDAKTLKQAGVFNAAPDNGDTGIWQSDAGPAADEHGNVYVVTGNGRFNAAQGGRDYGDTVIKLNFSQGTPKVVDYFTPFNQVTLDREDLDLGSQGPVLLPATRGSTTKAIAVSGKGNGIYVIDQEHMGHFNNDNNSNAIQVLKDTGGCFGAAAYWNQHLFIFCSNEVLKDYRWQNGKLSEKPVAQGPDKFIDPGAVPTVSSNGVKDGIVWVIETKGWRSPDRPSVLRAYDAANVSRELYNSNTARDMAGKTLRFAIPAVMNGRVYIGSKGQVDVYGLLAAKQ